MDPPSPGRPDSSGGNTSEGALESTAILLAATRRGDEDARNRLFERYLPRFRQWAHGRVPAAIRDLSETDDLVQVTVLKALDKLEGFEPRREGAFLAYLRAILRNSVRDMLRQTKRRPRQEELTDGLPLLAPTPLEDAIGVDVLESYEHFLQELPERMREAVFLRMEFGFTYAEIAAAIDCPSANAARLMVSRGLVRLSEGMHGDGHEPE